MVTVAVKFKTDEMVLVGIIHDNSHTAFTVIVHAGIRIKEDFAEKFDGAGEAEVNFFAERESCFVFLFAVAGYAGIFEYGNFIFADFKIFISSAGSMVLHPVMKKADKAAIVR